MVCVLHACIRPGSHTNKNVRFGGFVVALTVPLLMSYPNPRPSQDGHKETTAFRKLTYITLGAGEVALGTLVAFQYFNGDSGLTENALLFGMGNMGAFLGIRALFLFARPGWMEAQENAKKTH